MKKSSLFSIIAFLAMTGFLFTVCKSPSEEDEVVTYTVTYNGNENCNFTCKIGIL
jgi:hypothetical protein